MTASGQRGTTRAALVAALMTSLVACNREGAQVRFVLPDDWEGALAIRVAPGLPDATRRLPTGEIEVAFPASGLVQTGDFGFLERWHREVFVDRSGRTLADVETGPTSTGSGSTETFTWYFRGSKRAADGFLNGPVSNGLQRSWLQQHGMK